MRWWMIALLLALVVLIFMSPPAWWAGIDHAISPVIFWGFRTVTYPVQWVLFHIWPGLLGYLDDQFHQGYRGIGGVIAASVWAFIYILSFFFWQILLSRFWKFIGRWNPYDARTDG